MQSPCVARCGLNDDNYCMGCFRHVEEIVGWSQSSNDEKKQILDRLEQRKANFSGQQNNQILSRDKWLETESKLANK